MVKKSIKNAFKCLYRNDIIESKHQHDFTTCQCGEMSIDGGTSYIRLIGDLDMMQEIWDNRDKYLGKLASVRYMSVGLKDKPRVPSFIGWRDKDDMS